MKYWINTISREHVMRGVAGGFTQANHGKSSGLKKMHAGDWIIFYSPRESYPDGPTLQQFTAIGQITDEDLYQFEMTPDFMPWRRKVSFYDCTAAPIKPLIGGLSFIKDPTRWGYPFRFGLFEIPPADFEIIRAAMLP